MSPAESAKANAVSYRAMYRIKHIPLLPKWANQTLRDIQHGDLGLSYALAHIHLAFGSSQIVRRRAPSAVMGTLRGRSEPTGYPNANATASTLA